MHVTLLTAHGFGCCWLKSRKIILRPKVTCGWLPSRIGWCGSNLLGLLSAERVWWVHAILRRILHRLHALFLPQLAAAA